MKPAANLFAMAASLFALHALAAAPAAPEDGAALAGRLDRWRAELPQVSGPHRVARLIEPDNPEYI